MSIVEYENYTSEIIQLIVTNYFLIKKRSKSKNINYFLANIFIATIKFIFDIFVSIKIYIYTKKLKLKLKLKLNRI